jgi:hypothetical protein
VPVTNQETYLGGVVRRTVAGKGEIKHRVKLGWGKINAVKSVWRGTGISKKRKLLVFQACIGTLVTYNLETITMNERECKQLDAAQMKMIRRALQLKPRFKDLDGPSDSDLCEKFKIIKWSKRVANARWRLFKNVVAADSLQPLHKAHFNPNTKQPKDWTVFDNTSIPPIPLGGHSSSRGTWLELVAEDKGVSLDEAVALAMAELGDAAL